MDLATAGLTEQPFRTHGKPVAIVPHASYSQAYDAICESCENPTGLALLQGPPLSGKSTIVRHFAENLDEDRALAVVDGTGLNTAGLLEGALRKFGYDVDFNTTNELLAMLRVFALQQTVSSVSPVLIIENAHRLNPSALRALCELAALKHRQTNALKMVLVSDRPLDFIIDAPAMTAVARRVSANLHMRPMTCDEARSYLRDKLRAAGSAVPEYVFPDKVCVELWDASGGWPGVLDRIALLALAKADALPVTVSSVERPAVPQDTWDGDTITDLDEAVGEVPQPPQLIVSKDGNTVQELTFDKPRLLIGRSEHNDISIPNKFVSRHHLLLVRHSNLTFMMDLNSSNGTHVNSKRVSNHVLIHNDVITIGHHHIKFYDPHATRRSTLEGSEFADTVVMKTLDDMRKLLAQENTAILPTMTENLPTYGNK